jgi:predicted ATPase
VHWHRQEHQEGEEKSLALESAIEAHGFGHYQSWRCSDAGRAKLGSGFHEEGLELMARGVAIQEMTGMKASLTWELTFLAKAHHMAAANEQALAVLDKTVALMDSFGEHFARPELHLLRAEILLELEGEAAAETSFLEAIEVARGQEAKLFELRAATALTRLWQGQGKTAEARELLQPIYDWFTEGLDTAPLKEARALLEELA